MNKKSKSSWATGGGLLIGLGIGFFLIRMNPLAFVGCIIIGLGFGLTLTAILDNSKKSN
jgi:F0F1-type ATP synthase assembly protein I